MNNITIPISVPSDLLVSLNESEQELKSHFQSAIAMMLFKEGKLTLGKAIQLSELTRFEFEKLLSRSKISLSEPDLSQVISDADKLRDL